MIRYVLTRFLSAIVVVFCVVSIAFFLSRMQKGGAFDREKEPPAHVKEAILEKYGINGSLGEQYFRYMKNLLKGDLGVSFKYRNRRVGEVIAQQLPVSLLLGGISLLLATGGGIFLGCIAAIYRNKLPDRIAMFFALLAISLPTFVTGPLLIGFFALKLGWLPVGGWMELRSMILPAICLAAPYVAYIARLTRNSMIEVLNSDFIRTARAKGLSEMSVAFKHGLKVGLLPVVGFLGPLAAHLFTGSIVVESLFSIPGAGNIFVNSILNGDTFLLMGIVIVYCLMLVLFNLVVDLLYGVLDPRIRLY